MIWLQRTCEHSWPRAACEEQVPLNEKKARTRRSIPELQRTENSCRSWFDSWLHWDKFIIFSKTRLPLQNQDNTTNPTGLLEGLNKIGWAHLSQTEVIKPEPSAPTLPVHVRHALWFSCSRTSAPQTCGRYGLHVCLHRHMSVCIFNPLKTGALAKYNKDEF